MEVIRKPIKQTKLMAMVLFFCALICARSAIALAAESQTAAEPTAEATVMVKLLTAIRTNDYKGFVADGTPKFKAGLTKEIFGELTAHLAPRLKQGYAKFYLGRLNQQGYQVYLWKLTFMDGGDDILVKMVVKDGMIAGFWLY